MKIPKARQLPSGSWCCRVRVDGQDISITKDTEKEAVAEAVAIKAGVKQATKKQARKSLTAAIDDYIALRQNILSPSTIRGYRAIQKARFKHMMNRDIRSVTQDEWQRAVNLETKSGCSAKTLTNAWRFVASVIFEVTNQRLYIRLPQIVPHERQWLTPEQVPIFVKAVHGTKVEIPALLALSSLRRSEIINLRWKDIDFDHAILRVNGAAVQDENNDLVRKAETKNKTSRRIVPIIPPLLDALEQTEPQGEYILTSQAESVVNNINKICRANGLPEVGLHGLRHSFASLGYHLGMPEKVTMEIGGWANDQTMHKIYTHISQQDINSHAANFINFFKNGDENDNEIP